MPNPRKRSAESAAVSGPVYSTTTPSKKRKVDNAKKYYAVRVGKQPGVYMTYNECKEQIDGFSGAIHKGFKTLEDAEAFVNGKDVTPADEPKRYYAVAVAADTGIFTEWSKVAELIQGVKGPKYKRFDTWADAEAYIKQFGNKETIEKLSKANKPGGKTGNQARALSGAATAVSAPSTTAESTSGEAADSAEIPHEKDCIDVYTDGSSLANGKKGARAGFGVYFGDNDPRNISEPLRGGPQTNQRAELMAMLRALGNAALDTDVRIISDSQYSIKCVTEWAISWQQKGWVNSRGDEVKNQEIIRPILLKIKERTENGSNTFFKWVKGHDKDQGNIEADLLAVRGAKMEKDC